jgi:hypothetical protein
MLISGSNYPKKTPTCYDEMKLILKSGKPKRLMGLKVVLANPNMEAKPQLLSLEKPLTIWLAIIKVKS